MLCYLMLLEDRRDEVRFIRLYQRSYSYLLQVGQPFFDDPTQSEDALHETFIKAAKNFKKISGFSCDKQVAYLVIMMKNQCRDMLRRDKKHLPLPERDDLPADGLLPAGWDEGQEVGGAYRRAVEIILGMEDQLQAVLTCRLVEERTNEQTARMLGISKHTASRRYLRGLEILRQALEEEGYTYEG